MKIGVVDYGSGNFSSVLNAVQCVSNQVKIIRNHKDFNDCTHIILPGVGTYHHTMKQLEKIEIIDSLLDNLITKKKPFLGICVGMQILSEMGLEHTETLGLGLVRGKVKKFHFTDDTSLLLPHIGWNSVFNFGKNILFKGINEEDSDFYFVNSYHIEEEDLEADYVYTSYGYKFVSALQKENIFGVQFHPEKSQKNGLLVLQNFVEYA